MKVARFSALLVVLLMFGGVQTALAEPILLHNTGLGLTPGGVDPNWVVSGPSCGTAPCDTYVIVADGYPIPSPYIPNSQDSSWIEPISGTTDNHPDGDYHYVTTFLIDGSLDPTTASIIGRWASDNQTIRIFLNGVETGLQNGMLAQGQYMTWTAFTLTSGFISGLNTLEFVVNNSHCPECAGTNPSSLRVELSGDALSTVPEPASLVLLGTGLAAAIAARRRRRQS